MSEQSDAGTVAQYSCMCGIGDKPCPGPDGRPLCDTPALAQSDAEPVAWRYKAPGPQDVWALTTDPEIAQVRDEHYGWTVEPLYTAPPRPDASGLIEAAKIEEIAIKCARHELNLWENSTENLDDAVARACATAARQVLRARAADRSGE